MVFLIEVFGCLKASEAGQREAVGLRGQQSGELRAEMTLETGWRFGAAAPEAGAAALLDDRWNGVMIPHTWNAIDGADGGTTKTNWGYQRGPAWYVRELAVTPSPGRRLFLVFEGASIVTDVYLNGTHLGQHRGAFGAFSFELTKHLPVSGTNELRVRVDNSFVDDVPPLQGDFTMFGGLYRPVKLLQTAATCISPLDHSSSGVALRQREVTKERAVVDATVKLSRLPGEAGNVVVRGTILDAIGQKLRSQTAPVVWRENGAEVALSFELANPRLWHGRRDPYLHTAKFEVLVNDHVVDEVTQALGLRAVRIDPQLGFFLNDEPYEIHGVCRHQDRAGKGWAVSEADHREDLGLILEMGANAVRLAHYPQSSYFYELCDRVGLIVWAEIPLVNVVRNTEAFHANARQQLVEMIRQHRNHPSIAMWGLFNELYHHGPSDPCEDLVRQLQQLAKLEDPTRPTVAASNQRSRKQLNTIPDHIAFNAYPGWYGNGGPAGMKDTIDAWLTATGNRGIGVSEYGAGGSVKHQEEWPPRKPVHNGEWHPEQYQAYCHEQQYQAIAARPEVWGSFVWNMFDFGSDDRAEGDQEGINDKGLVTYDRKTRKEAFYFYRANWNPEPMVHLVGKRFAIRQQKEILVRAYSNCDTVELFVNGQSQGMRRPDAVRTVQWAAVELLLGENKIELRGIKNERSFSDKAIWTLQPTTSVSPAAPAAAAEAERF
jgi:beta-galactosidase